MKKLTIALLSGGNSSEREVSLASGDQVYEALDKQRYTVLRYDPKTDLNRLVADASRIDAALIILHGPFGEDGTVQGLLDLLGIAYQGSGVLGSAVAMNKLASKKLYEKAGLPTPAYLTVKRTDPLDMDAVRQRVGIPLVVKPVGAGSSIGMSIVRHIQALPAALDAAFAHDDTLLLERYIQGTELTVGILGNQTLDALPVIEIRPGAGFEFFDYQAKYTAGATEEICPAPIADAIREKAQRYAKIAHTELFCRGYSRTDMMLSGQDLFILETNTIPGMTRTSLLPLAARTAGMSFSDLLDKLIQLGIEAHGKHR
jgi:D-alanine-D-alanine ligase